jgi:hypothetical protein
MGGLSIFHILIVIVVLVLYFLPLVKILQKAGYSGWWSLIVLVPLLNIIMLYVSPLPTGRRSAVPRGAKDFRKDGSDDPRRVLHQRR